MARASTLIQTDEKGLVRDMDSKALLATDKQALHRHRHQQQHRVRYAELETKVARLSSLVDELLRHG